MKARGYTAEVMVTENRMYRVSIASFATRGEAESELARLKSIPGLEACWLLSN
jgi:cell division protein FtsN